MSIFLDSSSRIVIQGVTGKLGRFALADLRAYGTQVVAGVAPRRPEGSFEGLPIFPDAIAACRETGANTALVYVPAEMADDATVEAFEAGCRLVVYPGDGLPVNDAIDMCAAAKSHGAVLVGPNTPGIISPGRAKAGFMPSFCFRPGPLGVISRSGSLSYEVCNRLTQAGLGQSTVIGIGGDPVKGVTVAHAVEQFTADPETSAIVYLGEIGGLDEYALAAYAGRSHAKSIAALVVGETAPPGRKMGHAAALISGHKDTHAAKTEALRNAGVFVARDVTDIVPQARRALAATAAPPSAQHA
jgi:succinyl-CoA synthetase alpha subunit